MQEPSGQFQDSSFSSSSSSESSSNTSRELVDSGFLRLYTSRRRDQLRRFALMLLYGCSASGNSLATILQKTHSTATIQSWQRIYFFPHNLCSCSCFYISRECISAHACIMLPCPFCTCKGTLRKETETEAIKQQKHYNIVYTTSLFLCKQEIGFLES